MAMHRIASMTHLRCTWYMYMYCAVVISAQRMPCALTGMHSDVFSNRISALLIENSATNGRWMGLPKGGTLAERRYHVHVYRLFIGVDPGIASRGWHRYH